MIIWRIYQSRYGVSAPACMAAWSWDHNILRDFGKLCRTLVEVKSQHWGRGLQRPIADPEGLPSCQGDRDAGLDTWALNPSSSENHPNILEDKASPHGPIPAATANRSRRGQLQRPFPVFRRIELQFNKHGCMAGGMVSGGRQHIPAQSNRPRTES